MSKKLMIPFLTEWLIKHGTNPTIMTKAEVDNMAIFYKAVRKNYIVDVSVGNPLVMKLTKEGVKYLQDNQK